MSATIIQTPWCKANSLGTGNDVRAVILCDSVADLPAPNAFPDFTLIQGSKARCIAENMEYMMDSNGGWYIYTEQGVNDSQAYSQAQTDVLLAAKQDLLTFDSTPTQGSTNPVTSDGIYQAIQGGGGGGGIPIVDLFDYDLQHASYNDNTGVLTPDVSETTMYATIDYIPVPLGTTQIRCTMFDTSGNSLKWCAYVYDENKTYMYSVSYPMLYWAYNGTTRTVQPKISFIRLLVKNDNGTNIDLSDIAYTGLVLSP